MADPTVACPKCSSFVLEDTPQCLSCGYRFSTGQVEAVEAEPLASEIESNTKELLCPTCGVGVREHLVRCWNCGGFMRPEIAAAYEKMKQRRLAASGQIPEDESKTESEEVYSLAPTSEPGEIPRLSPEEPEEEFDDLHFDLDPETERVAATTAPLEPAERSSSREAAAQSAPPEEEEAPESDDPLLDIALQEEKESAKRRKQDAREHRKRTAEAKKRIRESRVSSKSAVSGKSARPRKSASQSVGSYGIWLKDVALHTVNPKKVKPKPGCLAKPTGALDIGFSEEGVLFVSLAMPGSLLKRAPKPEAVRQQVFAHLKADKPLEETPGGGHWQLGCEQVGELKFEQPNEYEHERVFGDVPVFGEGRVALRVPTFGDGEETEMRFLSFSLTEFRRFAAAFKKTYGADAMPHVHGVPLEISTNEVVCHYTDQTMTVLEDEAYYAADPTIETKVVGYRCESCQMVVGEDGRKKERIGGKTGSGLAKAKCPKCGERFGHHPLHELVVAKATTKGSNPKSKIRRKKRAKPRTDPAISTTG